MNDLPIRKQTEGLVKIRTFIGREYTEPFEIVLTSQSLLSIYRCGLKKVFTSLFVMTLILEQPIECFYLWASTLSMKLSDRQGFETSMGHYFFEDSD